MITNFKSYREFIKNWISVQPRSGHGLLAAISVQLRISRSLVSAILSGKRNLTIEQALNLAQFMKLQPNECDYFIVLVEVERAGTAALRSYWQKKAQIISKKILSVKSQVQFDQELSFEEQVEYYSNINYSLLRILSTIDGGLSYDEINENIRNRISNIDSILEFLMRNKLIEKKNETYFATSKAIHLDKESANYSKYHSNLRILQLSNFDRTNEENIAFSSVCTLSEADFLKIREMILDFVKKVNPLVADSKPNLVASITIDFMKHFRK